MLKPKNAKINIIITHVDVFISFNPSNQPEELEPLEPVDKDGIVASLDCNIALDKLLLFSIIIKMNILIFIINSHLFKC